MTKNNILLLVNNQSIVEKLKSESSITFLFPVERFCVGFPTTFKVKDIKGSAFIFINRILDNDSIEEFRDFILHLPDNIKGIVFDDIGILNILLKENISITKILFLNHFNCNYESINAYLEYVDSVVVSTDLNISEIDEILAHAKKKLVLYTFGHMNIMYSRRTLLSNYNKHFNKGVPALSLLDEGISHQKFKIIENEYGTVIYTERPFNGLALRGKKGVLYHLINTVFLNDDEILKILHSKSNLEDEYPYKYLSTEKMIVKLKEEKP
ncbi:MAG: U32 family peptidase [Bacilli bacterium]|nr:U32 family peptidase [Bacilli bacterium]